MISLNKLMIHLHFGAIGIPASPTNSRDFFLGRFSWRVAFTVVTTSFLIFSSNLMAQRPKNHAVYSWFSSNTGGGGYITGIVQDRSRPDILYARCDVGGVFKTINKGEQWTTCNNGMTKWYHHSVQSIAVAPDNSQVVFRCSGDMRNSTVHGSIHKSTGGGDTWHEVLDKVGYYGNGETRMYGELVAIDPYDSKNVFTAGFTNGIWTSNDSGETWTYRAGKDEQFATVAIHPYRKNEYYAGTVTGRLFSSKDQGRTWELIHSTADQKFGFTEFAFDAKSPSTIYSSSRNGIYKSLDGGKTFRRIMNGLPENFQYNTIVSDPSDTRVLYTAPDARPGHNLAPVPVYVSRDGGDRWHLIADHQWPNLTDYPGYMKEKTFVGWAIAKIRIDAGTKGGLMFSNWYGVSFSQNGGLDYSGKDFNGLETNCLENIQISPTRPDWSFYTVADHMPMKSTDSGKNYRSFPPTAYSSSTALVQSVYDSTLFLFGARVRSKGSGAIIHFQSRTMTPVLAFDSGYVQAIREDPFARGTFFCSVDGNLQNVGGIYKSTDWGRSWKKLPFAFRSHMKTLPHQKEFIENELLNIVVGQRKNVCGANQLLGMDPHRSGSMIVGEWTEGIFRSIDGGATWEDNSADLPFKRDTASVLTVVSYDPHRKDRIYAGFIREGLWRSDDGGGNWYKIFPADSSIFNVSTLHIGGQSDDEIYIGGENLYWSDAPSAILFSEDAGATWENIYDPKLGALRIKSLDVDPRTGRIVLATSGNGAFYAIRNK
jgi:photosystem II stability/assembly factor-like uncharacterized protein